MSDIALLRRVKAERKFARTADSEQNAHEIDDLVDQLYELKWAGLLDEVAPQPNGMWKHGKHNAVAALLSSKGERALAEYDAR